MLSIGKLGHGQEQYYLEAVAGGAEDYYVFAGEAPGRWAGGGTASLGLGGRVEGAAFTAVLTAKHPSTGDPIGRTHSAGKVPGFDLTFSAPKSVSLLFALGDEALAGRMRDAHDVAVADALGYLERTASHGRRGHGGLERVRTSGFVAAVFRHRTSRAGDPNLHSHVVVANRVLGDDGQWSALDARALYVQAKTAGTLYESSLRHQLRDLGLSWTVPRSGLAEIDGVPLAVRRAFSRRRQQIEQHLAERGLSSARAAQAATLQTRKAKDHQVDPDSLRSEWLKRADSLGFTAATIDELLREGREREPVSADLNGLLGADGLTARASSFGERDVLRAVANAHPDGLPVAEVEAVAAEVLQSDAAVELGPGELVLRGQDRLRRRTGRAVPMGSSERRYSTPELLALEERLVREAGLGRGAGAVRATKEAVDEALRRRPELNDEQVAMVRHLTLGGDEVDVVDAAAGAGKTTALGAVASAYLGSGVPVVGTTLSAKAAGVLRDQTGLPVFTTAQLLIDLRDRRSGGLAPGTVLVVDEAGQVGTRTLAELDDAVRRASGKLVLVGDPHQLPEIDAGGAFRGLLNRLEPVRMVANHRQSDEAERGRLLDLRRGSVAQAMTSYDEAGRVTRAETSEELRQQLVQDWAVAYVSACGDDIERARGEVVMLGLTNSDVDDLNDRAQRLLLEEGLLGTDQLLLGERGYRVGDHVVTRQNDRRLGVLNGQRWQVVELRRASLLLVPVGRLAAPVDLPVAYAEHPGRLQHGYAITTAVSQGSSVQQAFVLGSDATYREAGYTAASRARERTQFYVVASGPSELDEERHGGLTVAEVQDPLHAFVEALGRSAAQTMALDTTQRDDATYRLVLSASDVARLGAERLHLARQLADAPADQRGHLARLRLELEDAQAHVLAAAQRELAPRERAQAAASRPRERLADSNSGRWQTRSTQLEEAIAQAEAAQERRLAWEGLHRDELLRWRDVREALNAERDRERRASVLQVEREDEGLAY